MPAPKRASSRPVSAKRAPSGARPASACPSAAVLPRVEACAVCRDQPLIFHECPECSARYCAGGCLHSWYEHTKSQRRQPVQVPVVSSGDDGLEVELEGTPVKLGLCRAAGGLVVAEKASARRSERWGIASADGWVLGMPGPGPEWRPHPGVMLQLEELGRCQKCETPMAVPEYICNSAARAGSRGRVWAAPKQKRTYEACAQTETGLAEVCVQTELRLSEAEVQACTQTAEAEVQASTRPSLCQAQAAIAGHALASLARPQADRGEMLLTASPGAASGRLWQALQALAPLAQGLAPGDSEQLRAAESAIQRLQASEETSPPAPPAESERNRTLQEAMRQVAQLQKAFAGDGLPQVLTALSALSELLAIGCPGVPSWRQLATNVVWPWKGESPSGWPQLQDALAALSQLALASPTEAPHVTTAGEDCSPEMLATKALKAVSGVALFVDEKVAKERAALATALERAAPPGPPDASLASFGSAPLGAAPAPPGPPPLTLGGAGAPPGPPPLTFGGAGGAPPGPPPLTFGGAMNPVDAYIAPGAPPGPPPLTLGGTVNPVDAYLAGGAPPGPPPLTLGGAVNPVDAYLAGGAAKPPLTLGGAADPVDAFLAQPAAPGAANPVDEYLGGAPIQAPTFGRKAAAAPGGGGGAKDMKNAMQDLFKKK